VTATRNWGQTPVDPAARLQHALDLAYRYLGHRDRTVTEIRRHLEAKRVEPATIDEAVDTLVEQGYLDDARFAQRYAEDRRNLDAWGSERIERRLRDAGVPAEHIEAALGTQSTDEARVAAIDLLRRRFPAPPSDDRARERALGLLVRRGYDLDLAYDAVRTFEREAA
jgi:regulatory protein